MPEPVAGQFLVGDGLEALPFQFEHEVGWRRRSGFTEPREVESYSLNAAYGSQFEQFRKLSFIFVMGHGPKSAISRLTCAPVDVPIAGASPGARCRPRSDDLCGLEPSVGG